MKNLNLLHFPIGGIKLIEASAGTGKTYSLIIIYIKLLLNLEKESIFKYPLKIKDILVVTFTKSAAYDLKIRIRENIRKLRLDCIRRHSDDYIFSKLLLQIHNIDTAITLLSTAEREINQASILTIHGFCQKMLKENPIELDVPFNINIEENQYKIYQQICFDFWRRYFYGFPLTITSFILEFWKNPEELLQDIISNINIKNTFLLQNSYSINQYFNKDIIIKYYTKIISFIDNIKQEWNKEKKNLINIVHIYNVNSKIYNKKNLTRWINIINSWAIQKTLNHNIPNYLQRFSASILQINTQRIHYNKLFLFNLIEELYQLLSSFKPFILNKVINDIQYYINNTKEIKSDITFDDLIKIFLYKGIKNKHSTLPQKILLRYPVAMIDEIQDTDVYQYKIFHSLYSNSIKNSLIIIGDPKQAIYNFRGSNISTYIQIHRSLNSNDKYYLNTNWRSSPGMVNAVNHLFKHSNPFIFPEINFHPSLTSYKNNSHKLIIHNKPQASMCFWLYSKNPVTINNYKMLMAKQCAVTLQKLLHNIHNKTAYLEHNKFKRNLRASDITILIKNYTEASLIQSELLKKNISTIFLSDRKSIFDTIESYELLLLLKTILIPKINTIYATLSTTFFKLNSTDINNIHNNTNKLEKIFEEFREYHTIWKNHSILSMIQKIIFRYKIPEKLLLTKTGKNSLINILHIAELLNNISNQFNTRHELIQWLEIKITEIKNFHKKKPIEHNYKLRLDTDDDLIKISTIHQAKGLEFPLTFLPFIMTTNNKSFSHTNHSIQSQLNFIQSKLNYDLSYKQNLSEDIRLLYVAVTRSIYHCSIGIAPIIYSNNNNKQKIKNSTSLKTNALEYLITNKNTNSKKTIKQYLTELNINSNGNIIFQVFDNISIQQYSINTTKFISIQSNQYLKSKIWKPLDHINNNIFNITSYSTLKHNNILNTEILPQYESQKLFNNLDLLLNNDSLQKNQHDCMLTAHDLPVGKEFGNFFHDLFKILDFSKFINKKIIKNKMELYNIDTKWTTTIQKWIYTIINTPINCQNLTLSKILSTHKQAEVKFNLFINNNSSISKKINDLCKNYDDLSHDAPSFLFSNITGILTGYIDLIFFWNNKYYLLDYKTNWLGKDNDFYITSMIKKDMIKNRYDVQYQLYAIALHRFLKSRIISYNYTKNFGGIYYLFVRGMNGTTFNNGIYFNYPSWKFIEKMDKLLSESK